MIRYRSFWSAMLAMFLFAGCAYAQAVVPAPADSDRVPEPATKAQPAPAAFVITNTDAVARTARVQHSHDDQYQERSLDPQPTFSRKATIVLRGDDADYAAPAPELSRAVQLILRR